MSCNTCGTKRKKRKRLPAPITAGDWVRLTRTFNQYPEGSEGEVLGNLLGGVATVAFMWGVEPIPVGLLERIGQ